MERLARLYTAAQIVAKLLHEQSKDNKKVASRLINANF